MKKLVMTSLVCLLTLPAFADEEVDRRLNAAPDGQVNVSNIAGSVTVNGWNRSTVEVTGTLGRNVEELIFERDGDRIEIKVKVPKNSGRGIETELRISVPKNSSLDIGTVSADIDVSGVAGEQSLGSVSGDIRTDYAGGDFSAQSVSGDVEVSGNGAAGEVVATTVSGDVTLFRVSGQVEAEAVSGDVVVDEGLFERADLSTVSGDLVFQGKLEKNGRLSIDTVNGSVNVELDGDVSARFEIDTFNGGIRNCFGPKAERTSKYAPGWELEFTEGGGNGRVEISTMNGGVTLCKK